MSLGSFFIYRRGSTYYIQFEDGNGKTKQVSTGCRKKSDALQYALKNRQFFDNTLRKLILSKFITKMSEYGENVFAVSTLRSYKGAIASLMSVVGDVDIRLIDNLL